MLELATRKTGLLIAPLAQRDMALLLLLLMLRCCEARRQQQNAGDFLESEFCGAAWPPLLDVTVPVFGFHVQPPRPLSSLLHQQ